MMVRIRVSYDETYEEWVQRRHLKVCRAHRMGWPGERPYGFQDLPTRIEGEYHENETSSVSVWQERGSPYDLQVMMNWGSYKAMMAMMCEGDVVEGMGLRVALALQDENP